MSRVLENIKADLYRYAGDVSIKYFFHKYFTCEGFKFSVWLRLCYEFRRRKITKYTVFPFCKIIYNHYRHKFGFDIPYTIEIGPGLRIFHFGCVIFTAERAGKNLTLSHGTTVGMTIKNGMKKYPHIGDNVYLAPGSNIIGGVQIGDNVAVGTNAVLNQSVEDGAVVVGIPARVVSYSGSKDYINNPI